MNDQIKTSSKKFLCIECQNENELAEVKVGDVIECKFCGIEYDVKEVDEAGEALLAILESEK